MSRFQEDLGLISPTDAAFLHILQTTNNLQLKGATQLIFEEEEEKLEDLAKELSDGGTSDSEHLPKR